MALEKTYKTKNCPVCAKEISEAEEYCCLYCQEKDEKPEIWYDFILEFFFGIIKIIKNI
jgi:predicted nucleic acid-binding Zn ribbon protein